MGIVRSAAGQKDELQAVKAELADLRITASKNDAWLGRILSMALLGLRQRSLAELLSFMTSQFGGAYKSSTIAVRLVDTGGEIANLLELQDSSEPLFADVLSPSIAKLGYTFPEREFGVDAGEGSNKLLARSFSSNNYAAILEKYSARKHRNLFPRTQNIRSVAVVPLVTSHAVIGLIALGSKDPSRFTPGQGTDFLELLGTLSAVALENQIIASRLRLTSLVDPLTGLFNRRYLDARLSEEIQRAIDNHESLACLLIDADNFKKINDSLGHLGGDAVLKEMARRIRRCVKSRDVLARFGGEEFIVIARVPTSATAQQLAERIRVTIASEEVTVDPAAPRIQISASIGCCWVSEAELLGALDSIPSLLVDRADAALYAAKRAGRNCVRVVGAADIDHY